MNNKIFSQINIIYKHTFSIKSALRRNLITNEYASFAVMPPKYKCTETDCQKCRENAVIDLAEYVIKYHLEEPKYICM